MYRHIFFMAQVVTENIYLAQYNCSKIALWVSLRAAATRALKASRESTNTWLNVCYTMVFTAVVPKTGESFEKKDDLKEIH